MALNVGFIKDFFDSLNKLRSEEQNSARTFVLKFFQNPKTPGFKSERVTSAKSKNIWSRRVSKELRAIVHQSGSRYVLCYVGHHDRAYQWAKRRNIEVDHCAAQVRVFETEESNSKIQTVQTVPHSNIFDADRILDLYLLSIGIPENSLQKIRCLETEDELLRACEELPDDVSGLLRRLAEGEIVPPPTADLPDASVTDQAVSAQQEQENLFWVDDEHLLRAMLNSPLDQWIGFLHPTQRALVEKKFSGPAKVSGSAGTGKTVVAMQRARFLARYGHRVLITSFVKALCDNIEWNLKKLCSEDELSRIRVLTVQKQAKEVVQEFEPDVQLADDNEVDLLLDKYRLQIEVDEDEKFLKEEWKDIIATQGIQTWDAYRKASRTGRTRPLSVKGRKQMWSVFGAVLQELSAQCKRNRSGMAATAENLLSSGNSKLDYTAVIVDEVQDLLPTELRFLHAICKKNLENLMLCGDSGQRIYAGGFSLRALGIETRGRSEVLRLNYRTTEQIRQSADQLLGDEEDDMTGGRESRRGTISLRKGTPPNFLGYLTPDDEMEGMVKQIEAWRDSGINTSEIGVFARTNKDAKNVLSAIKESGISCQELKDQARDPLPAVSVGTMHRAKGLEFKAVLVYGCSEGVIPSPGAMSNAYNSPNAIASVEEKERKLLYVAMTRARDKLTVSWSKKPSRFLDDIDQFTGTNGD